MSTATGSPTRKQLDELEELLQRMLSLPVNPADAATTTTAPPATGAYPATFSITTGTLPPANPHSAAAGTPPPAPIVASPLPRAIPMRAAPPPPAPTAQSMPPVRRLDPAPGDPTWSVPLPPASSPTPAIMPAWPMGIEATAQQMQQAPPARPVAPM